jgi:hypothetical protein
MDWSDRMEQEVLPLANEQLLPPALPSHDHWTPTLAPGFSIVPMVPDGNCFYRSVSDQLYRDEEGRHVLVHQQIYNQIRRNRKEFKDFLLLNDSDLEVLDLAKYIERMGQDGEWAGNPESYAAAW